MRRTTSTAMAAALLALVACSPSGFNTPTLLNKVRILAIQADPPQPALGASTTLSALVYQPPPSADAGTAGASVTGYSWSWCPLATSSLDGFKCPIDQDAANQLFASLGVTDAPLLALPALPALSTGEPDTAKFTNPFPAPLLASLCEHGLAAKPGSLAAAFKCTIAGFPITISLVVQTTAGDLPAVFLVYLPINDAIRVNLNPVVNGISVKTNGADHQLDQAGTQEVPLNSKVPVSIAMEISSAEDLPDPNTVLPPPASQDPNNHNNPYLLPNTAPYEHLNLSWYAECGDFGANGLGGDRTTYLGDPNNLNSQFGTAIENTWNIPKTEGCPIDHARMIVVVRDNRGGVAWTSGKAHVVDALSDAGVSDALEADDVALDAGVPDSEAADSADAILESTP